MLKNRRHSCSGCCQHQQREAQTNWFISFYSKLILKTFSCGHPIGGLPPPPWCSMTFSSPERRLGAGDSREMSAEPEWKYPSTALLQDDWNPIFGDDNIITFYFPFYFFSGWQIDKPRGRGCLFLEQVWRGQQPRLFPALPCWCQPWPRELSWAQQSSQHSRALLLLSLPRWLMLRARAEVALQSKQLLPDIALITHQPSCSELALPNNHLISYPSQSFSSCLQAFVLLTTARTSDGIIKI